MKLKKYLDYVNEVQKLLLTRNLSLKDVTKLRGIIPTIPKEHSEAFKSLGINKDIYRSYIRALLGHYCKIVYSPRLKKHLYISGRIENNEECEFITHYIKFTVYRLIEFRGNVFYNYNNDDFYFPSEICDELFYYNIISRDEYELFELVKEII